MKYIPIILISFLLTGCAASLKFIDQQTGDMYYGKTDSTFGGSGNMTAEIENENYRGDWIYSASGGGFTLGSSSAFATGTAGYASAYGTSTAVSAPTSGSGLITMKGNKGGYVRCVFNFNTFSDTGIGQCLRNDGKKFDITLTR